MPPAAQRRGPSARTTDGCNEQEKGSDEAQCDGQQNYDEQIMGRGTDQRIEIVENGGHGVTIDSAEKPSVHPSRISGRTEEQLKSL
jgi:hypothetical protein